jgi:peptidyl-prolyl cis-trans isomerase B (cyclophilin B)
MRRSSLRALLLAALPLLLAAGCGGGGGDGASAEGCTDVEAPRPREAGTLEPPGGSRDVPAGRALVVRTSCGTFSIELTPDLAPNAVASLVALAETGYFNDTVFHRIVPGFVIQGGDPTQTGGGGPGYSTVDPPPDDARYVKGTVAMAKTLDEPPGTAGSQFFVVTTDDAGLSPDYALVGTVTGDGLEVVERIGLLGDEAGRPTKTVVIEDVAVRTP